MPVESNQGMGQTALIFRPRQRVPIGIGGGRRVPAALNGGEAAQGGWGRRPGGGDLEAEKRTSRGGVWYFAGKSI